MSTINQKLGLHPKTRIRAATHGSHLITAASCPTCGGRHVIEQAIHGVRTRICGACGEVWEPRDV